MVSVARAPRGAWQNASRHRGREWGWWRLGLAAALVCGAAAGPPAWAAPEALDNDTCLACHGDAAAPRFIHPDAFRASVHGQQDCTTCHTNIQAVPHVMPAAPPWQTIPEICGQCHGDILTAYRQSVHGRAAAVGKRDAPVCTDCHGIHTIARVGTAASRVFPSHIPETCGQCHAAERIITKYRLPPHVVDTYMDSFHGLALRLGSLTAANCASCHGAHDILPSSDPRSSVNPKNLAETCGQCHAGVSAQVTKGQIHSGTRPGLEHQLVSWVRQCYLTLIVLVIGGMVVHNLLDFRRKLIIHRRRMAAGGRPRMGTNERFQHAVLILAFATLAYTGFALKFPQTWWASPFIGATDWRGFAHRLAAALFCVLAIYHAAFMVGTRAGRRELRALRPRRVDTIQLFQMLAYYLGRRAERPVFARYSYVEKAEYWALVWGSIVMAVTGGLMVRSAWTLRVFPKWFFDIVTTIHYYEAILACLAIVVWHFYFTIFDPDEYPMKWTWVTGHPSDADRTHRTDAEE